MEKTRLVSWRGKTRIMQNRFIFLQPWRCRLLLLFAPILHRSEPHFRIRMENQFILAQKTEAIGENRDFFHLRATRYDVICKLAFAAMALSLSLCMFIYNKI